MFFESYFKEINNQLFTVNFDSLFEAAELILNSSYAKKKTIVVGNGGSAAMSSHISVDLTKAAKIRSTNFNEADLLTCLANDYGYESWVSKALEFYADKNDTIILFSSSGTSNNILNGAKSAKKMGLKIITFSGFDHDNPLRKLGDVNFWVDSRSYNIIEMTHHVWGVSIIDYIIENRKNLK